MIIHKKGVKNMLIKKINKLIQVTRDNLDDLYLVDTSLESFITYVKTVARMEKEIPLIRIRSLSQEELIEGIQQLDTRRRRAHNSAIASVSILNRICKLYGIEELYEGNLDDRQEVAQFAKDIVNAYISTKTN